MIKRQKLWKSVENVNAINMDKNRQQKSVINVIGINMEKN